MTIPEERYIAVKRAREFLRSLLNPKATPKVPRVIRMRARSILKHFPGELEMDMTWIQDKKEIWK